MFLIGGRLCEVTQQGARFPLVPPRLEGEKPYLSISGGSASRKSPTSETSEKAHQDTLKFNRQHPKLPHKEAAAIGLEQGHVFVWDCYTTTSKGRRH